MRIVLIGLGALAATLVMDVRPSSAQAPDPYPWCAYYSGRGGGGSNCYFSTLRQCQASVSGVGGYCSPNPWHARSYAEPGPRRKYRRKHRHN
jgi:hypothetical protein